MTAIIPLAALHAIRRPPAGHWRVLDIGCRDGRVGKSFASCGCNVVGIDIGDYQNDFSGPNMAFVRSSFESYQTEVRFDLIVARHVLPFASGSWDAKVQKLVTFMSVDALAYISAFTAADEFAASKRVSTIDRPQLLNALQRYNLVSRYEGHERFSGPMYDGTLKRWDIVTLIVERAESVAPTRSKDADPSG